jgi:uncharacterized protein YggE
VRDADAVNAIVLGSVSEASANVMGPQWVVEPENPGRLAAYRRAALDARARAAAYADALGLALGAVLRIEEPAAAGSPSPSILGIMADAAPDDGGPEPVHAGDVDVDAAVIVTFALEPGR